MVLGKLQCRVVLLIWIRVGQGPTAVGAGGSCLDIFSLVYHFSVLSPSLWETARYRLKYCLKGSLNPKQPTNQSNILMFPKWAFSLRRDSANGNYCLDWLIIYALSEVSYLTFPCEFQKSSISS